MVFLSPTVTLASSGGVPPAFLAHTASGSGGTAMKNKQVDILRSGFLTDGRFFSIEAGRIKGGNWGAWMVCVPSEAEVEKDESHALYVAGRKEQLRRWAEDLSEGDIEGLAES